MYLLIIRKYVYLQYLLVVSETMILQYISQFSCTREEIGDDDDLRAVARNVQNDTDTS